MTRFYRLFLQISLFCLPIHHTSFLSSSSIKYNGNPFRNIPVS